MSSLKLKVYKTVLAQLTTVKHDKNQGEIKCIAHRLTKTAKPLTYIFPKRNIIVRHKQHHPEQHQLQFVALNQPGFFERPRNIPSHNSKDG